ncbi:MAG: 50S ribosomal subunit-associated GTPase HflX, partial [Planctomycetota bacterium]
MRSSGSGSAGSGSAGNGPFGNGRERSPAELRTLRERLAELAESIPVQRAAGEGLARALDRLDRDLLPRTAGGHEHLVAGVVGPNNAGKSALFNSIVAGPLAPGSPAPVSISPSLPTGGATRRLVGALSPELREILEGEPT